MEIKIFKGWATITTKTGHLINLQELIDVLKREGVDFNRVDVGCADGGPSIATWQISEK